VLPYLLLCREDSPQRKHDLRTVFNAVRYVARTGGQWRFLPREFGPWWVVYQQMQRWLKAGCFELLVEDVRSLLREWGGRKGQPTAVCIDSRTLQSTPENGARAGYDGAKRRKGPKIHIAVDTLGHLLPLRSRRPIGAIASRSLRWPSKSRRSPAGPWRWLMSIRDTPGRMPPRPRNSTACAWRWSNTPWRREASSCCQDDGSSSVASPGPLASAASPETTND